MKRVPFFTIKYSNNQNLKCFPPQVTLAVDDQHKERWSSPGAFTLLSSSQVSCGPSRSWYWSPWWWGLHMIWEFRAFPGCLCILSLTPQLLRYMWEGRLGQETMEQDLEVHQGFTNWWELALLVYFSAIFIGNQHLSRHHTFQIHEIEIFHQLLTTGTSSFKLCWLPAQGERLKGSSTKNFSIA